MKTFDTPCTYIIFLKTPIVGEKSKRRLALCKIIKSNYRFLY